MLEWIGAIATRKFTTDIHLVKSIRHVLKRGDILALYPEARYTPCGTLAFLPESIGKMVRMNKVPVVAVVHHGNHLYAPFWNFRNKRKVLYQCPPLPDRGQNGLQGHRAVLHRLRQALELERGRLFAGAGGGDGI